MEPQTENEEVEKEMEGLRRTFLKKSLKFTEAVVVWVTILYLLNWIVSVVLITLAIKETKNFAYLDILITETGETFRIIVGASVIKFGVENIFKYNDFGGRVPSRNTEESYDSSYSESENNI